MRFNINLLKVSIGAGLGLASMSALALDCSEVVYGNDNYFDNMQLLAEEAELPDNYFNRYHESLVSDLCKGDEDSAFGWVDSGYVDKSEYSRIKNVLGLNNSKQDFLHFYTSDDYGNKVYFADGASGNPEFIIIDGSPVSMLATINMATILDTGEAGYAFLPGNGIDDINKNSQFAKIHSVDCDRKTVGDDDGTVMRLSNMSAFHQTSAGMACSVLEAQ